MVFYIGGSYELYADCGTPSQDVGLGIRGRKIGGIRNRWLRCCQ